MQASRKHNQRERLWRGIDYISPANEIAKGRSRLLDNCNLTGGRVVRRKGYQRLHFSYNTTTSVRTYNDPPTDGNGNASLAETTLLFFAKGPTSSFGRWLWGRNNGELWEATFDPSSGTVTLGGGSGGGPISREMGAEKICATQVGFYTILTSPDIAPKYYDVRSGTLGDVPGLTNLTAALCLNSVNRVLLADLEDDGTIAPNRVKWSTAFNGYDINEITWPSSYYNDLPNKRKVTALAENGKDVIAFNEQNATILTGTGKDLATYEVEAEGCIGLNAWANVEGDLVYLSQRGPQIWLDGGFSRNIADKTWFEAVPWFHNEKIHDAVVSYDGSLQRVMFTLPGAIGGKMEQGRVMCLWPKVASGDYEWTEYWGYWPQAMAYGETETNREGTLFGDDYGFLNEADIGETDGFITFAPVVTASSGSLNTTSVTVTINSAKHDVQANALAGMYCWNMPADRSDTGVLLQRITANAARSSNSLTVTINPGLASVANGSYLVIGGIVSIIETRAFDMGLPENRKQFFRTILEMPPIGGDAQSIYVFPRTDGHQQNFTTSETYATYPGLATISDDSATVPDTWGATYSGSNPVAGPLYEPARVVFNTGGTGRNQAIRVVVFPTYFDNTYMHMLPDEWWVTHLSIEGLHYDNSYGSAGNI